MAYLVIMAVGAIASAVIASGKHRSALAWGVAGALFPLISLIIIVMADPRPQLGDGEAG